MFKDDTSWLQNEQRAGFQKNYNQSIVEDRFSLEGSQEFIHKTVLRVVDYGWVLLDERENIDLFVRFALRNIF